MAHWCRMCFNEAGAVMPRKGVTGHDGLSVLLSYASMRPGLLCPGKGEDRAVGGDLALASMRPGLLCPGKASRS